MRMCCEQMEHQLKDERVAMKYSPIFREYSIYVIDWGIPMDEIQEIKDSITAKQCIDYCPWCSTKLPRSLRDKYFEILRSEFDPEVNIFNIKDNPLIPEEFKTDEWWKKRKL